MMFIGGLHKRARVGASLAAGKLGGQVSVLFDDGTKNGKSVANRGRQKTPTMANILI